ncbi:arylsulfatase J-like isoform X1 [Littorina saxatilis]|uniref:arylsulfatase J-like isoform X1 n=1 Tax=Littorina saxatilis TaxID=31220 RepID=UPI0038B5305D
MCSEFDNTVFHFTHPCVQPGTNAEIFIMNYFQRGTSVTMGLSSWMTAVLVMVTMATVDLVHGAPNIIILMGDDVGFADYEINDPAMRTPANTALAQKGLTLNQSYTLQTCTPTRTALLTGRYSYKLGMQLGKIKGTYLRYVPVEPKLLPASLKDLNYTTHAVGKWHLGFCDWKLTPRYRGFDTFYGFFSGAQGYFNHSGTGTPSFDFRDNGRVAWENKGLYSTELHTTRVQEIIRGRKREPFFIYMAYQNAHSPWEAKQSYIDDYCSHVQGEKRRIHCAMVAAMDESIKNITDTLDEEGIADDTILLVLSDNGGPLGYGSYNWPLRGGKSSFWEGGLRSHTVFVHPKWVVNPGTTWDSLIHVTDWYPTLYKAAGGNPSDLQEMDGIDQYWKLIKGKQGTRDRVVLNIDDKRGRSAVRIGDMKLLTGKPCHNSLTSGAPAPPDMEAAGTANSFVVRIQDVPEKQLFNVRQDPRERNNLIDDPQYAEILRELEDFRDYEIENNLVPFPANIPKAKEGKPEFYSGAWSPGWCCAG